MRKDSNRGAYTGSMGRTIRTEAVVLRSFLRGGRPHPARVHGRARTRRGDCQGRSQDEVALRGAPRAVLPRRAHAPPGLQRALELQSRASRSWMRTVPRARTLPSLGRSRRCGGDASPLRRGGAERARVRGADEVLLRGRRAPGGWPRTGDRPARAGVPAQAPLAFGVRAAPRAASSAAGWTSSSAT